MANIFDKWDKSIDVEGLAADVREAEENGTGSYKEVEPGEYEVAIEKMEVKESSKGTQMVSIWFKVVSDGEYKGSLIFMNQVITQGFQIHIVNKLLRAMTEECDSKFKNKVETKLKKWFAKDSEDRFSYSKYNELLLDIHEQIADNFEYALKYGQNKKGYSTFEIKEVFVLE